MSCTTCHLFLGHFLNVAGITSPLGIWRPSISLQATEKVQFFTSCLRGLIIKNTANTAPPPALHQDGLGGEQSNKIKIYRKTREGVSKHKNSLNTIHHHNKYFSLLQTGRVLTGPAERECLINGTWSGEIPLCREYTNITNCNCTSQTFPKKGQYFSLLFKVWIYLESR